MTDYVLAGLAKRRAKLSGEAEMLRARLVQIATERATSMPRSGNLTRITILAASGPSALAGRDA